MGKENSTPGVSGPTPGVLVGSSYLFFFFAFDAFFVANALTSFPQR